MSTAGAAPEYASDLVVDQLTAQGIRYVALNPGASFRGLHDSLVNRPGAPVLLEVPHEKIAIGIAHGYYKATGEPMAVALHDLVGLLHGTLGVYYAWTDRVPVLVLGGAGPMDQARRRPWIDWIHTANVQNDAVRPFTKFDDHPYSVAAMPDVLERAYRVAMTEPRGPVYVALDAALQEEPLPADQAGAALSAPALPSRLAPDPNALDRLAALLLEAERPVLVTGFAGRDPAAWDCLQELADLLPAGVVDTGIRLSFPNSHPLNVTGTDVLGRADAVLLVDVKDVGQHTGLLTKDTPGQPPKLAPGARLLDLGFGDLGLAAWATDHGSVYRPDLQVLADTALALPALLARCRERLAGESRGEAAAGSGGAAPAASRAVAAAAWRRELTAAHAAARERWDAAAAGAAATRPIAYPWLAAAVWEAIRDHDWVLAAGTAGGWATRLWDMDARHRHPGRSLGTATQIGIALGVALAHRGTGRLVVDLQPDGDLLFDTAALWVATRHRIPLLVVMVNNRAYHNDVVHQEHVARARGRPLERAPIGLVLDDPAPDFAGLARAFGWYAEGPVSDPAQVTAAVRRAVDTVAAGQPALVDVICGTA